MNERDYHDLHYAEEAARVQGTALFERVHARTARLFLQRTGVGRRHRVLSLGCGDGSIERLLAPHVDEIVGVDISAVAISQAVGKSTAAGLCNLSFQLAQPGSILGRHLGSFDAVAAFAFLHHLGDAPVREVMLGARKLLRPGGIWYSTDPNCRRLIGLFKGFVRATYDRYHSPDERELDPRTLVAFAAQAGFTGSTVGYVDYFLGPLAWLAPATPRWSAPVLEAADNLALRAPVLNRYASSFSLLARAP